MSSHTLSFAAQRGRTLLIVLAVVIAAALAGGAWLLLPRFESTPPSVVIAPAGETVGQAAVQFAVLWGATVVATSSPSRFDRLRELGAIPVAYGEGLEQRLRDQR